jgi:hypothetical protein
MLKIVVFAALTLCAISPAEARKRVYLADPGCNVTMPCEGVAPSPRGEQIVKAMGGFGSAQKVYQPRAERVQRTSGQVVSHPAGCPSRAFCGCGAAVRVFGTPVRSLWLAANWYKFPRAAAAPGMVAVRRHHIFVLETHLQGNTWLAYDANSGRRLTRIHARSIAGYTIVDPRA